MKAQHFHTELLCQNPFLRQMEWEVQNGPITKKELLPMATLVFGKFN